MTSCASCGAIAAIRNDMEAFQSFLQRKPVPDLMFYNITTIPDYGSDHDPEKVMEDVVRILLQTPIQSPCSHPQATEYEVCAEIGKIPLYRILLRFTNPATYSYYLNNTNLDPMEHYRPYFPKLFNGRYWHHPNCYKEPSQFFPLTDPIDADMPEHFVVTLKRWPQFLIDEDMTECECNCGREIENRTLLELVFDRFYHQFYSTPTFHEHSYLSFEFFSAIIECGVDLNAIQWPNQPILSLADTHDDKRFDTNFMLILYFISHGLMDFRIRVEEWVSCQLANTLRFRYAEIHRNARWYKDPTYLPSAMADFQNELKNFQIFLQVLVSLDLAHLVPSFEKYIEGHVQLTGPDEIDNPVIPVFHHHMLEMHRPISLQNLARNCIRKELGGQHFQKKVELLPLPDLAKDAVRADYTWMLENIGGFCK